MTPAGEFPDCPEAVTARWLTEALGESFPGIKVDRVEVLDQHSGTTGRARLQLHLAAGEGPQTVFMKLPPFSEAQRKLVAMTDMGRKEARFYQGPGKEVPVRIPRAYYADHGAAPTEYVIVLEDLKEAGCRFASRLELLADDQGVQIIESLARLHAHFWNDARFDDEFAWIRPAMRGSAGARLVESARQQFAGDFPPVFAGLCQLYADHHVRIAELWDEGAPTLIHGDTHAGNQYVGDDGVVGLYDWAVISRSPGIRDVAIYLGNSSPTEVRRLDQDHLLRRYREVLVEAGIDAPSAADLWFRYRIGVLYSWVAAATTASMGDTWQPIEAGMLGMTRATDACADLETIEAVLEAL